MVSYIKENGLMLYVLKGINSWKIEIFNYFLARRLGGAKHLNIHPSAQLLGVSHFSIGRNFNAGKHLRMEAITTYGNHHYNSRIVIKDNVAANDFVHIAAVNYVEIGNNVLIAGKVYISDHNHGIYSGDEQSTPESPPASREILADKSVIIEDNVWLGEFVSILPGVTVGKGSIIGANSVVSRNIPPYSIAMGAPARVVKRFDEAQKQWLSVE